MYNRITLFKNFCSALNEISDSYLIQNYCGSKALEIEKAVIYSKLSRYEFERKKHKNLDDKQLEKYLRNRGTDFEKLVHYHDLHKRFESYVATAMKEIGIEVEIVNRFTCKDSIIEKSNIVIPIGGDGTFLAAAGNIFDNKKPIMGFNSDPNRSEGYLCLPKRFSSNIKEAFERLRSGNFDWLMRSRIRTTLIISEEKKLKPKFLHDSDNETSKECLELINNDKHDRYKVLPFLALNEVFMGETLSARVSHLQMRLDGASTSTNLKCSGFCVSTGTGSTSWHLSMNRLPVQSVAELLRLLDIDATESKNSLATLLADIYNRNLIFAPDSKQMGYTIKDLISAAVWPQPKGIKPRGFANKIEVKSNCFDASLVIDGGVSYSFNDGSIALLEILPECALKTVSFKENF